jgi:predicted transcriptional regulator
MVAEVAHLTEARPTRVYRVSDEERMAVRTGMRAARLGELVPEDEMERFYQLHRNAADWSPRFNR